MANLKQRARMHAALGEPVRLAIIDHLALGDASPGELGRAFSLATNLLAHHLHVLQEAGLIRRIRSEGDKRRNYVQLVLDDPMVAVLTQPDRHHREGNRLGGNLPEGNHPIGPVQRVLFVCTQNSARSQLASAAWARAHDVPSASAGTHPAARVHPRAIAVGRRHGLRLGKARTAHLDDVVQFGDLIVAVCDNAHEELVHQELPATEHRQLHWSVPDPTRLDSDSAFEAAYQQITQRVERLADALPHYADAHHADAQQDHDAQRRTP